MRTTRGWLLLAAAIVTLVAASPSVDARTRRTPIRSMTMVATAYCLRGLTATGGDVHRGTVASDPQVLPFGTHIRILGRHIRGTYVVEDKGSAMKGRRIDIFMPRCDQARQFGRQRVTVTIERLGVPVPTTR